MIVLITSLLSLIISFFLPWYFISVLSVGVYSFRTKRNSEVLLISSAILVVHIVASVILDINASGLISFRISGLFGLPFSFLFHLLVGLVPSLVFLMTSYVVLESRTLVKGRSKFAEKRG